MPRFYFDFENGSSTIDDEGGEYPDVQAAYKEALMALGEYARDFTRNAAEGRLVVRIRDEQGIVLEVVATIEAKLVQK
jgi:Domain of unknown function (DUF6894)